MKIFVTTVFLIKIFVITTFFIKIFIITSFFINIFVIIEKVNTKTLIHYQSSSSVAKWVKQNTLNTISLSRKDFESREEQIIHESEQQ